RQQPRQARTYKIFRRLLDDHVASRYPGRVGQPGVGEGRSVGSPWGGCLPNRRGRRGPRTAALSKSRGGRGARAASGRGWGGPAGAWRACGGGGCCCSRGSSGVARWPRAREALWLHYPRPGVYFADPAAHAWLAADQWAGEVSGPWRSWNLNRLAFHPDLLDLAERFLGSADLRLYEASLWAKYAGAVDYDQRHHRDFVNHSRVVPKRSEPATQMLSWILLSDVGDEDGPTKIVPLSVGQSVPYWPIPGHHDITNYLPEGMFAEEEMSMTGPAGT